MKTDKKKQTTNPAPKVDKNWQAKCENCGATPTVGRSRLCGSCYFGEADTANGDW